MSFKINRINSSLLKEISYILATEVKDKDIKFVTVTAVETTNDLSFAKIYVTVLEDEKKDQIMKSLQNAKGFIRSMLYDRVDLRHIPELNFVYDESIDYGNRIENIIDKLHENNWLLQLNII